ncbi:MAG: hypothetical protein ACFFDN_38200 [Candidatus Hodarchaeota archaeon]
MSLSLEEKLREEIKRLRRHLNENDRAFLEIFGRLRSVEHTLRVFDDVLRDFNQRFFDLLFLINPEATVEVLKEELTKSIH